MQCKAEMVSRGAALIVFAVELLAVAKGQTQVTLPSGEIEGSILPVEGYDDSVVFYGVPYADPPVGENRFRSPRPVSPWSGVRDASKPAPTCIQDKPDSPAMHSMGYPPYNKWEISEDCLTLDVYTRSFTGKQPVMVFIHGGGLQAGTSSVMYDFRAYSSVKDIVMVSIQYRIGALGWASMGDEHMPANLGLQDQVLALIWVQENIEFFGGDPDQVTIFGQSAGGYSVSLHIISPMSKGLFKRAILQSGAFLQTVLAPPIYNNTAVTIAFAECLGCPTESSAMSECLRKFPAERFAVSRSNPCTELKMQPTIDGTYFPDDLEKYIKTGQYNRDIDVMLGTVQNEGYFITAAREPHLVSSDTSLKRLQEFYLREITKRYPHLPLYVRQAQVQEAVTAYVRDPRPNGLIEAATQFLGDSLLLWPTYAFASGLSETLEGNTFFYELRHRPSIARRPDFIGTDHCDELTLMLGSQFTSNLGLLPVTLSEDDKTVADAMFTAWSNFAIHGNPNSQGAPKWPQFDSVLGQYMVFDVDSHVEVNFQQSRINYWKHTLPQLASTDVTDIIRGPIAETTNGRVQGKIAPLDDASQYSYAFMAIPFASPPVGAFRFKPPQPAKSWKGIRDATKFGNVCAQDVPSMQSVMKHIMGVPFEFPVGDSSEDCLTLDVYTPSLSGQRPVMVFIHGGGFTSGWSSMTDMRVYAAKYNVVGVAIQYRLAALGFMSTEDDSIKGNMGFKDQILSLKWVKDNIANFGGDPSQVTIFGESAGSWGVSMHLISPRSKGLFKRAIMMSGSVVGLPHISPNMKPLQEAIKLANALGCPNTTSDEITNCLLNEPTMKIVEAATVARMGFYPVLDNECFTDVALTMMEKGDFQKDVDLMAGFTFVEGFMLGKMFFPHLDITNLNVSSFRECVSATFTYFMPGMTINPAVADEAIKVYVTDSESPEQMTYAFTKFVGDCIITHGTYNTAMKTLEFGNQKVYMYDFHGRPFYSNKPEHILADHGDDLPFAFGFSKLSKVNGVEFPADKLEEATLVEDIMMQYFSSFAETGVPSGDGLPKWPELSDDSSYMQVGPVPQVKQNYKPDHMKFWLETFPALQALAEKHDEF